MKLFVGRMDQPAVAVEGDLMQTASVEQLIVLVKPPVASENQFASLAKAAARSLQDHPICLHRYFQSIHFGELHFATSSNDMFHQSSSKSCRAIRPVAPHYWRSMHHKPSHRSLIQNISHLPIG